MSVELTEALLAKAAGWDVMKRARTYLEQGQVASSYWAPPLLRGVVQSGENSYRASMVIHNDIDIENLCNCREARQWGKICAHGVAVGLHWLKAQKTAPAPARSSPALPVRKTPMLQRESGGEPAALFIILPPNFDQALTRGKVMLVLEAKWGGGRCPLNVLPKGRAFAFSSQDNTIIEQLETLANGETPALLQMDTKDFAALIPLLVEHENITLGKASAVTVTKTPFKLPLRATLETNGEIILSLGSAPAPGAANDALVVGSAMDAQDARNVRREGAPNNSRGGCAPLLIGDWVWRNNTLQPLGLSSELKEVFRAPVRVPRAQVPQFLSQHWPQLSASGGLEANFKLEDFSLEPQAPRFLLALKGGLAQFSALLQCAYGSRIMAVGVTAADENVWLPGTEIPTRYSARDFSAEHVALARLQRSGFSSPDANGKLHLLGQRSVLNCLAREFPKRHREGGVTLDSQSENRARKILQRVEPQFQITSSGVQ